MTRQKLPLSALQVKSFTTSQVRGGMKPIEYEAYDTRYSGVCTCLMDCASRADLSCPDGCPVVGITPGGRG